MLLHAETKHHCLAPSLRVIASFTGRRRFLRDTGECAAEELKIYGAETTCKSLSAAFSFLPEAKVVQCTTVICAEAIERSVETAKLRPVVC